MAPFGTIYSLKDRIHPRARAVMGAASLAGHDLSLPDVYEHGKTNKTPEFTAKFPLGKIPVFEGADGFLLSESSAITHYLADTAHSPEIRDQLLGSDAQKRALVQQWVLFTHCHLETTILPLAAWRSGVGTYDAAKEAQHAQELEQWLGYIEAHLKGRKWFVDGEGPSLVDLTVGNPMHLGYWRYIDASLRKQYPATLEWFERMQAVPELKEIYKVEMVEVRQEPENA